MNAERLIHMVINMVIRRGVNRGINAGINTIARGGKRPEDMTHEERQNAARTSQGAQQARRLLRQTRRFW